MEGPRSSRVTVPGTEAELIADEQLVTVPSERRGADRRTSPRPGPDRRGRDLARAGFFLAALTVVAGLPRPVSLAEMSWSPLPPASAQAFRGGVPLELNDAVRATIHLYRNGMRDWFSG